MYTSRFYSLAIEALVELAPEIEAADPQALTLIPSLDGVLEELGSIPPGNLFLGMADDGLPILLNLYDAVPGSILVLGDEGAGKTALLKNLASVIIKTFNPHDVQFGVVTTNPREWLGYEIFDHCAGILPIYERTAMDFVHSLNSWAHTNRSHQSVIFLLDGMDKVTSWNDEAIDQFRWLLMRGPSRRVWPVVTLNSDLLNETKNLLPDVRTLIYGTIKNKRLAQSIVGSSHIDLTTLKMGSQFTMKEGGDWLKFWIPRNE